MLSEFCTVDLVEPGPDKLRHYRNAKRWDQPQLAQASGVNLSTLQKAEQGRHRPRRPTVQMLDDALEANGELLAAFGYSDTPTPTPADDASVYDGLERITDLVTGISSDIRRMEAQLTANREQLVLLAQRLDVDVVPVPHRPD